MAKFNGYVITEQGRNLIAKGLTGNVITFTKMQLGDGTTSNDGRTMTALVSSKADLPIIGLSNTGTGIAELRFLINNKDVTTGFYIKEAGVFAKGADGVEVLYAYNVSPNPDFIPPFGANNIIEIEYVDSIIVDQVANITASIDPSITYMTQAQISSTYVKKTDIATQTEVDAGSDDTKIVTSKKLKARLDSMLASITTNFVKLTQLATETVAGIVKISTTTQVIVGTDDTTAVSPAKLKARLDSMLVSITTNFVKLTQLATETVAGIVKISTTAQVTAGTDDTTAVSPAKLFEVFTTGSTKTQNGYQKLPGGLIVQWSLLEIGDIQPDHYSSTAFPIAFPNNTFQVNLSLYSYAGGNFDASAAVTGHSLTGFTFTIQEWRSSPQQLYISYIAIGN